MQPIDSHVHFFTQADLQRVAADLPYALPPPLSLTSYLDTLIDAGVKPGLINNVHLSILPDSENVFASFEELRDLQDRNPDRYGGIEIVGTILADPGYATAERLAVPQVKGIRIVLHDARPDAISNTAYATPEWQDLFARLRPDQHVHIYAQDPVVNLKVLRRVPAAVPTIIDHLGTCQPDRAPDGPAYTALLDEARTRGNVCFKGPGYRTSADPQITARFARRICDAVGEDKLLLQASDAPHVGKDQAGRAFADLFTPLSALTYTARLADLLAEQTGHSAQAFQNGACAAIFNPHQ